MIDYKRYPMPRVRHHVSSQVYLPAETQLEYAEWYPPTLMKALWNEWYGDGKPASVLDLGCGRGGFMLAHALEFPHKNILGLEVRKMLVDWINGVIRGEQIANAHALWYSVVNGMQWVQPRSIEYAVYLFPDPWPKRRHAKRRAFTHGFLDEVCRVLMPGGRIYMATDRSEVDEYQRQTITTHGALKLIDMENESEHLWPFAFKTDQQQFCERKGIPYKKYCAELK